MKRYSPCAVTAVPRDGHAVSCRIVKADLTIEKYGCGHFTKKYKLLKCNLFILKNSAQKQHLLFSEHLLFAEFLSKVE